MQAYCVMPSQEGNDKSPAGYPEERPTGYAGCLPCLWHKSIQDWKELAILARSMGYFSHRGACGIILALPERG